MFSPFIWPAKFGVKIELRSDMWPNFRLMVVGSRRLFAGKTHRKIFNAVLTVEGLDEDVLRREIPVLVNLLLNDSFPVNHGFFLCGLSVGFLVSGDWVFRTVGLASLDLLPLLLPAVGLAQLSLLALNYLVGHEKDLPFALLPGRLDLLGVAVLTKLGKLALDFPEKTSKGKKKIEAFN